MSKEKLKVACTTTVPQSWHDALRKNFVGYELDGENFQTPVMSTQDGIHFYLQSFIPNEPNDDAHDLIFMQIAIPEEKVKNLNSIVFEKSKVFADALKSDIEKSLNSDTELNEIDPNPEYLGLITKVERKPSIKANALPLDDEESKKHTQPGYINYFVSIVPASDEQIKEFIYFNRMSFIERIRLLAGDLPKNTKESILRKQSYLLKAALQDFYQKGVFTNEQLDIVCSDPEMTQLYSQYMQTVLDAKTNQEIKDIETSFSILEPIVKAGFFIFSQAYWREKLNISID